MEKEYNELKESYIALFEDFQKALEVNKQLIKVTNDLITELEAKNKQLREKWEV